MRERVGFVDAVIGRMVPVVTDAQRAEDPLLVCAEPYSVLPVDATAFKSPIPPIRHLKPVSNFPAWADRKLFIHNLGHAAAAYLGYCRGYRYVWEALKEDWVRSHTQSAMEETSAALARKHQLPRNELRAEVDDLLARFGNRALGDTVARVGRDPLRKLRPDDRIAGALRLCDGQGVAPKHVAFAAAAAIRYDPPDDPAASRLQALLREQGAAGVLEQVCGILSDSPLARLVLDALAALEHPD